MTVSFSDSLASRRRSNFSDRSIIKGAVVIQCVCHACRLLLFYTFAVRLKGQACSGWLIMCHYHLNGSGPQGPYQGVGRGGKSCLIIVQRCGRWESGQVGEIQNGHPSQPLPDLCTAVCGRIASGTGASERGFFCLSGLSVAWRIGRGGVFPPFSGFPAKTALWEPWPIRVTGRQKDQSRFFGDLPRPPGTREPHRDSAGRELQERDRAWGCLSLHYGRYHRLFFCLQTRATRRP